MLRLATVRRQRADGAVGFSGVTTFATVNDDAMTEIAPAFRRKETADREFDLVGIIKIMQAKAAGNATKMGVAHKSGFSVCVQNHAIGGLSADSG